MKKIFVVLLLLATMVPASVLATNQWHRAARHSNYPVSRTLSRTQKQDRSLGTGFSKKQVCIKVVQGIFPGKTVISCFDSDNVPFNNLYCQTDAQGKITCYAP